MREEALCSLPTNYTTTHKTPESHSHKPYMQCSNWGWGGSIAVIEAIPNTNRNKNVVVKCNWPVFCKSVIQNANSCSYTVEVSTSCSSTRYTRDQISLAFGDAYGNQVSIVLWNKWKLLLTLCFGPKFLEARERVFKVSFCLGWRFLPLIYFSNSNWVQRLVTVCLSGHEFENWISENPFQGYWRMN